MIRIICIISVAPILYLAGAFISAEVNPLNWSKDGRFWLVFLSITLAPFVPNYLGWKDE